MSSKQNNTNNITLGFILLGIGVFLLLRQFDFFGIVFPTLKSWWPLIFIGIGVVSLVKTQFKSGSGLAFLLFGLFFFIKKNVGFPAGTEQFFVPGALILLGAFFILRNRRQVQSMNAAKRAFDENYDPAIDGADMVNAEAIFTGIQRKVLSKQFKGGRITTIFGGTDIDLSQADLAPNALLYVDVVFGGVKLILPPHWDVQVHASSIFAGVEG